MRPAQSETLLEDSDVRTRNSWWRLGLVLLLGIIIAGGAGVSSGRAAVQTAGMTGTPCGVSGGMAATDAEGQTTEQSGEQPAEDAEFDQLFIDANVPHHAAIVTFATSALVRIEDPQLRAVALDIILDQSVEMSELRMLRERLYGSSVPAPMDEGRMTAMMSQSGMEGMDPAEMAFQMDPSAMAATICGAEEPDLTFIDLTIAHHQTAIMMGEAALEQAQSDELKEMVRHSVNVQRSQIEELEQIRAELTDSATPES